MGNLKSSYMPPSIISHSSIIPHSKDKVYLILRSQYLYRLIYKALLVQVLQLMLFFSLHQYPRKKIILLRAQNASNHFNSVHLCLLHKLQAQYRFSANGNKNFYSWRSAQVKENIKIEIREGRFLISIKGKYWVCDLKETRRAKHQKVDQLPFALLYIQSINVNKKALLNREHSTLLLSCLYLEQEESIQSYRLVLYPLRQACETKETNTQGPVYLPFVDPIGTQGGRKASEQKFATLLPGECYSGLGEYSRNNRSCSLRRLSIGQTFREYK